MTTTHTDSKTDISPLALLQHVDRYGLSVVEAAAATFQVSPLRARQMLRELVERGELATASLYSNRRYVYLTCRGLDRVGCSAGTSRPTAFSEPAKIRAFAMLLTCCSPRRRRIKLTRRELAECDSDLNRSGRSLNYYLDRSQSAPKLGFLRIDLAGRGRWDRVLAKAREDAHRHRSDRAFARFLARRAFEVRIVTALPQKARRLREALKEEADGLEIPIHVSAYPELINLIAPLPT